jgi:hydroxymethylglutaryl-CoA lyase
MTVERKVRLFEVGPRDGLQNEKQWIETADKIRLVDLLSDAGLHVIEVTAFVSPKWVPQMKDAAEVMAGIKRRARCRYAALTPNLQGYDAARAADVDEVAVFTSASEGFCQKNINCSIKESFNRFKPVVEAAVRDGMPVRGYVSCVTDCPYDGPVEPERVAEVVARLFDLGCYEVSLGDTIGAGTPTTVAVMLDAVLRVTDGTWLAGHYHDTGGMALANIEVSMKMGLRTFDTAIGGLGGCPFAPGAKGNVATEAVLALVEKKGFETDVNLEALMRASKFARSLRGLRQE